MHHGLFSTFWVAVFAVLLTTAALAQSVAAPNVEPYLSPQLSRMEGAIVRQALQRLPPQFLAGMLRKSPMRVSVSIIDGATGTAAYNRPDLRGALRWEPSVVLPGDDYPLSSGGVRPLGSCGQPFPGCYAGSGPYRRVYTPPVAAEVILRPKTDPTTSGYWTDGLVTTPCKAGTFRHDATHADVGNVYLGGWGVRPDQQGGNVDAGLQYNWGPTNLQNDNYSLYMNITGVGKYVVTDLGGGMPAKVDCGAGELTELGFAVAPYGLAPGEGACPKDAVPAYTPACDTYLLSAAYATATSFGMVGWIAPSADLGGWARILPFRYCATPTDCVTKYRSVVTCGGCIFKWMTSIAQKNTDGYKEDLHDGSTYGATWSMREIAPWAINIGATSGDSLPLNRQVTFCSEYPLWPPKYDAARRDCTNTPGPVPRPIRVAGFNWPGETDFIDLRH